MKLKELYKKETSVPIIFGGSVNGLGLARSFGKAGIQSIVYDTNKDITYHSKYTSGVICPNPTTTEDLFINFLIDEGKKFKTLPFILVTNDLWLLPISKHSNKLKNLYILPMSNWEVIQSCSIKSRLYKILESSDISLPRYCDITSIDNIYDAINNMDLPVIIKPSNTVGFMEALGTNGRNIEIHNKKQLDEFIEKIQQAGFENRNLIIQELIPGGIDNLYTITTYSNKNFDVLAYSTGHKIRQNPPNAGTIVSGKVTLNKELLPLAQELIKKMKFFGIANTEFKYDQRDGKYKLIEINPRPGKWNSSALSTGINIPLISYKDYFGKHDCDTIKYSSKEIIWADFLLDFYYATIKFKKSPYTKYSMNLKKYFRSIKGKKTDAILSINDIKPFLFYLKSFLQFF